MTSVFLGQMLTEKSLIESVLASFYILDYGYIKEVKADKTIDVVHAKKLKLTTGKDLKQTVTHNVEVLTLSAGSFSISIDYKKGDKVLLLGLKNYIPKVKDVTSATETTIYQHYTRETLKAIPLCVFNGEAKVTVEAKEGTLKIDAEQKIELNGNDKQFVTWAELDSALKQFTTALKTHTHECASPGSPSGPASVVPPATLDIDISSAKTTTVVTGG